MPSKVAIPFDECTVTREERLKEEQRSAQAHLAYVHQSLSNLGPWLLRSLRKPLTAEGCAKDSELNFVNGVHRLKLKTSKAQVFLIYYPPRDGDLCLRINFVVDGNAVGSWRMRPGPSHGNPLTVEYAEPVPGTSKERITPLSTGYRLNLNGLTDRTFRDKAIDEHIVKTVQDWFKKH